MSAGMWSFPVLGYDDPRHKSKLDEFFHSQSSAASLVREAIQNSLDAGSEISGAAGPVMVRFTLGSTTREVLRQYSQSHDNGSLFDHLSSLKISLQNEKVRYILIEDYNTSGLTGETDHLLEGSKSHFIGFWWEEGLSHKKKGSGGSHGVGKTTLTSSSQIHTFLALTKRADDGRDLFIGFANLPYHSTSGRQYKGHGRFGSRSGDRLDPCNDSALISRFTKDFGVDRKNPGLSVVIPAVLDEINADEITRAVVADYYMAILKGALRVEVTDRDSGKKVNLTADEIRNLHHATAGYEKETSYMIENAAQAIELRSKAGQKRFFSGIEVKLVEGRAKLMAKSFSQENLDLMKQYFAAGELVGVKIALQLEPVNDKPKYTNIDVFLRKEEGSESYRISQYVRSNLIIQGERPEVVSPYSFAMVIADEQEISDYLRLAEEPSHTKWYLNRLQKEGKYKSDWQLRFVKAVIRQLYDVLTGLDEDEQEVSGFAKDIFWINEPALGAGELQLDSDLDDEDEDDDDVPPVMPLIINRNRPIVHLEKDRDGRGFSVISVNDIEKILKEESIALPLRYNLKAAYLVPARNAFSMYSKFDFDLGDDSSIKIEASDGVEILERVDNQIIFNINKPDFNLAVRGFDGVRDLTVKCRMAQMVSEEA